MSVTQREYGALKKSVGSNSPVRAELPFSVKKPTKEK
ncbi:MAG: hypothetical protein QOE90_4 [Thermoplasmata archaeon]|jgi:hypothetical protein|nr:hypothetical protein [Thermoplasmata archaeon]